MKSTPKTDTLQTLLARSKELEQALANAPEAPDVEGQTMQLLMDNRGKITPAQAVEQAQKQIAEKTANQIEFNALFDEILSEVKTLQEELDKRRAKALAAAESVEDKTFADWMKKAGSELIAEAEARARVFILTSAAAPVFAAYEAAASIPAIRISARDEIAWKIERTEAPSWKRALEARTPITRPSLVPLQTGDLENFDLLISALS